MQNLPEQSGGQPKMALAEENIKLIEKIVLIDQRQKLKEIAKESGLACTSVQRIIKNELVQLQLCKVNAETPFGSREGTTGKMEKDIFGSMWQRPRTDYPAKRQSFAMIQH